MCQMQSRVCAVIWKRASDFPSACTQFSSFKALFFFKVKIKLSWASLGSLCG